MMEIWLKKHFPDEKITALNNNNQAIEALIAGHVDLVLMDGAQGAAYSHKHPGLAYTIITKANVKLRKKGIRFNFNSFGFSRK